MKVMFVTKIDEELYELIKLLVEKEYLCICLFVIFYI